MSSLRMPLSHVSAHAGKIHEQMAQCYHFSFCVIHRKDIWSSRPMKMLFEGVQGNQ
jgi:hypothetical protein